MIERVTIVNPPPDCDLGGAWEVVEEFPLPGGDSHVRLRKGNSYFGTQRSNVRSAAVPATCTVAINPADAAIIDRALGVWSSDYNDAPHDDIARIRKMLAGGAQ